MTDRGTMLVILDGVPLRAFATWFTSRRPSFMNAPIPLVSTFPSLTNSALAALLNVSRLSTYGSLTIDQDRFCLVPSRSRGERVDAASFDLAASEPGFALHALTAAARQSTNSATRFVSELLRQSIRLLGRTWRTYLEQELAAFSALVLDTRKPHVRVMLSSFDELIHREGLPRLDDALDDVFAILACAHESGYAIAVLSDHGNAPTRSAFRDYARILRKAGFDVTTSLFRSADVLIPLYSTVNVFPVYTRSSVRESVVSALAHDPGVDCVAWRGAAGDAVYIQRLSERSRITDCEGVISYDRTEGDVFRYGTRLPVGTIARLRLADWLERTIDTAYPDGPYRVLQSFRDVDEPADLLVSLHADIVYGWRVVHRLYDAVYMHGGLHADASVGFLATSCDYPANSAPTAARMRDVREYLHIV